MMDWSHFFVFPSIQALVLLFLASTLVSFVLFRLVFWVFPKLGFLDNPAPYGHKRAPVPFGIGIVLFLNFAIFCGALFFVMPEAMHEKLLVLLVLGAIVTAVSFIDDLDTIFKFDRDAKIDVKRTAAELQ